MKLSEVTGAPSVRLSQVAQQDQPSGWEAVWEGLKRGARDVLEGGAQIGVRMAQSPQIGQTAPEMPGRVGEIDRAAQQSQAAYAANPAVRAHPLIAGAGRLGGNVAATSPAMLIPGAAATIPGRMALGALGAGASALPQPVPQGDYWQGKRNQLATALGLGAATGGVLGGRAMPQQAAQMAAQGVPLTAGMATGSRAEERALSALPVLRDFIYRGENRTAEGFQRATANQVLEPIGGRVSRTQEVGYKLYDQVKDQIGAAYDQVLPKLSPFSREAWDSLAPKVQEIASQLNADEAARFERQIGNIIGNRFDTLGRLDGAEFKKVEAEIGQMARRFHPGTINADLGYAYSDLMDTMRQSFAAQQTDPAVAAQLQRVNLAYAMFARMRSAAASGNAYGFGPKELEKAVRGHASDDQLASGSALLQPFIDTARGAFGGPLRSPGSPPPAASWGQSIRTLGSLLGIGGAGGAAVGGVPGAGIGGMIGAAVPYGAYGAMQAGRVPAIGRAASVGAGIAGSAVADSLRPRPKAGGSLIADPPP